MNRTLLKSKIHRATVTDSNVEHEGAISIDPDLMKTARLWPYERIEVYNVSNGERFTTYVTEGEKNSREVSVNGAAAHLADKGHELIIASYAIVDEKDLLNYQPTFIFVDKKNQTKNISA